MNIIKFTSSVISQLVTLFLFAVPSLAQKQTRSDFIDRDLINSAFIHYSSSDLQYIGSLGETISEPCVDQFGTIHQGFLGLLTDRMSNFRYPFSPPPVDKFASNEISEEQSYIYIYPNPSHNYISVYHSENGENFQEIKIMSLVGTPILRVELGDQTEIDVSSLPSGHYLIHVIDNKGQQLSSEFIKL